MSFQSRLMVVQLVLILILVAALSIGFYASSVNTVESNAVAAIESMTGRMSQQMDNLIKPMDFISINLLSDGAFMSGMKTLALLDRENPDNARYVSDAYGAIYSSLMNYTVARDFHRVTFFNLRGDMMTSRLDTTLMSGQTRDIVSQIDWVSDVQRSMGRIIIVPPYEDPWQTRQPQRVFSVCRTTQNSSSVLGYLEVQGLYHDLESIFSLEGHDHMRVVALTPDDQFFYASDMTDNQQQRYRGQLINSTGDIAADKAYTLLTSGPDQTYDEIVSVIYSDYTGMKILVAQNRDALLQPLASIRVTTFLFAAAIMVLSFVYLYLFSRHLTKPLTRLKSEMEQTGLNNLPDSVQLAASSNNEIEALNTAFVGLRERLNESLDREITARNLHLQASFESLQARVNPHFIYNILNVIANRGLLNNDPETCEICSSIASMLRYSTATSDLFASMADEVDHVSNYLTLMQKRYEHHLQYEIDFDPEMLDLAVPKMILQPLVENAINHGFADVDHTMKITVSGTIDDHNWCVRIMDNGQGFSQDVLDRLQAKIADTKKNGVVAETGQGINGMGILNVYSRLALFYHSPDSQFSMQLENRPEGGALITLQGYIIARDIDGNLHK